MPRISKVYWPAMKMNYGDLFDIQNWDELTDYFEKVRKPMLQVDFGQALKYKQGLAHANMLATMAEMKGIDLVSALAKFQSDIGNGMDHVLADYGRLFVNHLGGYFGYHDGLEISDTRMTDVWAFPTEKVRIIQWDGGTHYYAKVGNADVIVNGQQKWDTHEEAEEAGKIFLKSRKR